MAENDVEPDAHPEPDAPTAASANPPAQAPEADKSQYVVVTDADAIAASTASRTPKAPKGPLKPESLTADYVVMKDGGTAAVTTPIDASPTSATEAIPEAIPEATPVVEDASPQIVYVDAPVPPKPAGNRAFGALIAVGATVIFAVLFAFAVLLILRAIRGFATMSMLVNYGYWIPVGLFLLAFLVVVLFVNRAGWWAHIIGSFLVGIVVYVLGAVLITAVSVFSLHQDANVSAALVSPTMVAAAIIAREVALWAGLIVSHRGKRVVVRNRDARAAFDTEQAANARESVLH